VQQGQQMVLLVAQVEVVELAAVAVPAVQVLD
jgi:hypothetical protein